MKSIRLTCLTAILVLGMIGCASQSDIRILENRVISLERQNMELQQQTAENIDAKAAALRNQSASLHVATDQVRNEFRSSAENSMKPDTRWWNRPRPRKI